MAIDKHRFSKIEPCQRFDQLIEKWCERSALQPLKNLLRAYPGVLIHTDPFGDLLEAFRDVKGLCRSELKQDELDQIILCINELKDCINTQANFYLCSPVSIRG